MLQSTVPELLARCVAGADAGADALEAEGGGVAEGGRVGVLRLVLAPVPSSDGKSNAWAGTRNS